MWPINDSLQHGHEVNPNVTKSQSNGQNKTSIVRRASATKLPSVASEPVLDGHFVKHRMLSKAFLSDWTVICIGSKAVEVDKVTVGGAEFKTRFFCRLWWIFFADLFTCKPALAPSMHRFSDMVTGAATAEPKTVGTKPTNNPTPLTVVAVSRTEVRYVRVSMNKKSWLIVVARLKAQEKENKLRKYFEKYDADKSGWVCYREGCVRIKGNRNFCGVVQDLNMTFPLFSDLWPRTNCYR